MKAVDMFCGAGGMGLALKSQGVEISLAFDFDKYAIQSYRHNIDSNAKIIDITKLQGSDIPLSDLWTFGFPCQDLSIAGNRLGLFEGKRSGLFFEVMRLLDEVTQQPEFLLIENVKGLEPFLGILEDELSSRQYYMSFKLYNSKYWGVPQSRERYYILASKLSKPKMLPEIKCIEYILEDILVNDADSKYFMKHPYNLTGKQIDTYPSICVTAILDMKGQDNIRRVYDPRGLSPTLTTSAGGHRQPKILLNGCIRKLTPREYARLQGFPDDYQIVVSDSQAYKQFGNAVTIPLAAWIIKSIKEVL